MFYLLKYFLRHLQNFFLPYQCVICLESSDQQRDICHACQNSLPLSTHTCRQCAYPLSINTKTRCGECIKNPPYFDSALVGFHYQAPIDIWLKQFKFYKQGLYSRFLTEIYAEKLEKIFTQYPDIKPHWLIPVPLHWRRITQRGFNQAYIIAEQLSKKLNIPLLKHRHVKRIKYTPSQSSLNRQKRKNNLKNVFFVQNLPAIKHAAIVDDIFTTGSTVNELAKELKKHGVSYISVLALARASF